MAVDKQTVTLGNILSIITTVVGVVVAIVTATSAISDIRSEMRIKVTEHETRLIRIEADQKQSSLDHDLLIEIRQDLRQLRASFDKKAISP